jgi:hypothetical protein
MERVRPNSILRDIRPDIKVRLSEAVAKRDLHRKSADIAEAEVEMLTKMLDRENARFGQQDQAARDEPPKKSLPDFVLGQLTENTMNKAALAEAAEEAGYFKPDDYPLRAVHAVTVNLLRTNKIREIENGMFDLAEDESAS